MGSMAAWARKPPAHTADRVVSAANPLRIRPDSGLCELVRKQPSGGRCDKNALGARTWLVGDAKPGVVHTLGLRPVGRDHKCQFDDEFIGRGSIDGG